MFTAFKHEQYTCPELVGLSQLCSLQQACLAVHKCRIELDVKPAETGYPDTSQGQAPSYPSRLAAALCRTMHCC